MAMVNGSRDGSFRVDRNIARQQAEALRRAGKPETRPPRSEALVSQGQLMAPNRLIAEPNGQT